VKSDFERLIDDLDPTQGGSLTTLTNPERHDVARFVEQLRLWGKYNMVMTDLSPFLTDAKSVIEGELAQEILLYAKETEEFPVNMSEFMESHSVSKITGSPPGYVGHDEPSKFVEAVRRNPYSLILFDEIEKAHSSVLDILLQILDEGHLTDSHGRNINFKNTIIVMTSNLGTEVLDHTNIGFKSDAKEDKNKDIQITATKSLRPEFINRIDEIITFRQLEHDDLYRICKLQFDIFIKRVKKNYNVKVIYDPSVIQHVLDADDTSGKYGAREIKRNFRKYIENNVAELLVNNMINSPEITITIDSDEVKIT